MNNIEGNHHSCVSLVIGHLKACCPCDQLNSFTGWEAVSVWSRLCDDGSVSRALWPGRWSQVDASFPSVFSATLAWYQLVGTMLGQCSHEIWTQLHSLLTCQPLLNSQLRLSWWGCEGWKNEGLGLQHCWDRERVALSLQAWRRLNPAHSSLFSADPISGWGSTLSSWELRGRHQAFCVPSDRHKWFFITFCDYLRRVVQLRHSCCLWHWICRNQTQTSFLQIFVESDDRITAISVWRQIRSFV